METIDARDGATLPIEQPGAHPPIVKKNRGESHSEFYERAEKLGVGRCCRVCKGKRRFAQVQCPYCFNYMFFQIQWKPPREPVEGEPKERETIQERTRSNRSGDDEGGYTFQGNPDFDPATGDVGQVVQDMRPLADRNVKELKIYAAQNEVPLGSLAGKTADKWKAPILEAIEEHMGGLGLEPPSPETVALDEAGQAASESAAAVTGSSPESSKEAAQQEFQNEEDSR